MTNEQIEELINYLNENKNNLPNSMSDILNALHDKVSYEISKQELLSLDNVFFIESSEDILDFIMNNPDLTKNKPIETQDSSLNLEYPDNKIIQPQILSDKESIDLTSYFRSLVNEQHPKDSGSQYPTNVPVLLSKEEIQRKLINFPEEKKIEELNHETKVDNINKMIKAYKEEHKIKQLEILREKDFSSSEDNAYQWIELTEIDKLTEEIATFGTPDKVAKVKKYLDKLTTAKSVLHFDQFDSFISLNQNCPNFKEVSQFYKGNFVLNNSKYIFDRSYFAPTPILLLGEPGIGKTHFAKKLAKLLGTSFHFMDANSITASWVLTGSSGQWQNADAGNIFKFILDSNTISPVVILDEIDKLSQGKNYDPFSVFHQMFEPENATHFKDEFLNITFDASKIIYILTANNINNIPESLLSRMRVFDIQRPNEEEMKSIAQNIYSEIVGNSPLFNKQLSDDVLNKLVSLAPRDMKKQISNAVFNQAADSSEYDQILKLTLETIQKNWGF